MQSSRTSVDHKRTQTLNASARNFHADRPKAPGAAKVCRPSDISADAGARRCRQSGNPGSIEARSRGCVGMREASVINRVMHTHTLPEKARAAAGSQRKPSVKKFATVIGR